MKLLKTTKYSDFYFDESQSLFLVIRRKKTQKMTSEEYKQNSLLWAKLLEEYKPEKQLIDDVNMEFIITPELQKWALEHLILPAIERGLKKAAFVESVDTFSKIAVEQTMEEDTLDINFRYFDNLEQAKQWLEIDFEL